MIVDSDRTLRSWLSARRTSGDNIIGQCPKNLMVIISKYLNPACLVDVIDFDTVPVLTDVQIADKLQSYGLDFSAWPQARLPKEVRDRAEQNLHRQIFLNVHHNNAQAIKEKLDSDSKKTNEVLAMFRASWGFMTGRVISSDRLQNRLAPDEEYFRYEINFYSATYSCSDLLMEVRSNMIEYLSELLAPSDNVQINAQVNSTIAVQLAVEHDVGKDVLAAQHELKSFLVSLLRYHDIGSILNRYPWAYHENSCADSFGAGKGEFNAK
ncbi:MAG: hypothetical protein HYR92_02620 [Burkholderiales bacterium]|nr:hypothetical protein [Burkholderiales bacterium]